MTSALALVAIVIPGSICVVQAIHAARLIDLALPGLPVEFRSEIADSIALAPTTFRVERFEHRLLIAIKDPYLHVGPPRTSSGDRVQDAIYSGQEVQGLAPMAVTGGVLPLRDISDLKDSSLWELGKAVYLGQRSSKYATSLNPADAQSVAGTALEDNVRLVRSLFKSTYGRAALSQACASNSQSRIPTL